MNNFFKKLVARPNKTMYSPKSEKWKNNQQKKEVKMQWLSCAVGEGQFSGEYAVKGKLFNSEEFSMFVPQTCVKTDKPIVGDQYVQGYMKVSVLDQKENLVLVGLPNPSFENGYTITVKKDQLQEI